MIKSKVKFISIVRWRDQHYVTGPLAREDMLYECIGQTTGYLVAEDDNQVALASEWFEFRDDFRHVIHIPKCAIISHKKIKIA